MDFMSLAFFPFLTGIFVLTIVIMLFFWIWAIIDCLRSDLTDENKLLWIVIIVLLNIIGAVLYFIFAKESENIKINVKNKKGKKLMKSRDDKIICGVCGGLANYFNMDPVIMRLIFVLIFLVTSGHALLLYIVAAIIMPYDDKVKKGIEKKTIKKKKKAEKKDKKNRNVLAIIGITLLVLFVIVSVMASSFFIYKFGVPEIKEKISLGLFITQLEGLSEKQIENKIKESYNYKEYEGTNLLLKEMKQILEGECETFLKENEAYLYKEGCKEYTHSFETTVPETKSYEVKTIMIRNEIISMVFLEK